MIHIKNKDYQINMKYLIKTTINIIKDKYMFEKIKRVNCIK